jgi:hypothetical protein
VKVGVTGIGLFLICIFGEGVCRLLLNREAVNFEKELNPQAYQLNSLSIRCELWGHEISNLELVDADRAAKQVTVI